MKIEEIQEILLRHIEVINKSDFTTGIPSCKITPIAMEIVEKQGQELPIYNVVGLSKCEHKPSNYKNKHTSCIKCGKILQMKP